MFQERRSKEEELVLFKNGIEWLDTFGYTKSYEGLEEACISCDDEEINEILKNNMKYTKKEIAKAFLKWVENERLTPSNFTPDSECIREDAKDLAKQKSNYLIKLINEER